MTMPDPGPQKRDTLPCPTFARNSLCTVEENKFSEIAVEVNGLNPDATLARLAEGSGEFQKHQKAVLSSLSSLGTAVKKQEASSAAKSLIKLSSDLCAFAAG